MSHFYGDLNLVKENGEILELLNTRNDNIQCADFEYIENDSLIIVPDLINKKLFGYKLK